MVLNVTDGLTSYILNSNMYILVKLEKRAETTDTILYYAANHRSTLEEIILSLYNDLIINGCNKEIVDNYINTFSIIQIPLLED